MAADGQVVFEIKGDPSNVNQTVKQVTNNIQQESKKWDQAVDESTQKAGNSFLNWKTVAAGAITAIGAAVINFGKEAIEAASDLSEVQNVVDTVFGDGARQIESWAQTAGEKFGLTETQAKRFTSTLGAMMKSSGLAGKEIVEMSTDLAGLAADMASFYNLDFETAFEKIRAGISGETMPLKQLGINMSVANLEAFALAQGLEKTFSEMSQGEQTMLRYQYMMQATADAQGDFEKTADGFANAQRRIHSSLESIKTSVGKLLIEPFSQATASVADFLAKIAAGMMPEKTVIDEFNEAKIEAEDKLAEIQVTYDRASDLIKILKDIEKETATLNDGTTVSLTSLFGDIAEIQKSGGDVEAYISSLGLDVDDIILKYNKWKEATKQLTSIVPSLTNVINSETGAINGGTDALQKNLDEWKKNEQNKVYWAEYYANAEAVARAKGEQAGLQITAQARQLAADRAKKEYEDAVKEANNLVGGDFETANWSQIENGIEIANNLVDLEQKHAVAQNLADQAQQKAAKSAGDLSDAEKLLADELTVVEQLTGESLETHEQGAKKAAEATKYLGKTTEEWTDALKDAPKAAEAIKAVVDYYKNVRDATEQAVNSTVKGFEKITSEYDELKKKQTELSEKTGDAEIKYINEVASLRKKFGNNWMEELQELGEASKEWKDLSDAEREAYNTLVKLRNEQGEVNEAVKQYKPEGMIENLNSQIEFMKNYMDNLQQLKDWGVSDELIASLADGSKESASYLQGLVEGGEDAAKEVGGLFDQVAQKKDEFTKDLTDAKLQADEAFQNLVTTATAAMNGLDFSQQGYSLMTNSLLGVAAGINDKVPAVSQAVSNLIDALSPLSSLGFSFGFTDGSFLLELPEIPHFAGGTDWIPSNNFPAFLDYGEAVLTAEENQIWQRFKNGPQPSSMDYDALGGVMRDNVKAGGDVYLDGRTVGHVMSDIQGKEYRNLQRSGWQR